MASFGKKTRSPGFQSGNHWCECERCGFVIREHDMKVEWNGLRVCPECWEIRQPQDFVRGVKDDQSPKGIIRPESPEICLDLFCATLDSRADFAIADCAIADLIDLAVEDRGIPSSTFDQCPDTLFCSTNNSEANIAIADCAIAALPTNACTTTMATAGVGVAGCMVAGVGP